MKIPIPYVSLHFIRLVKAVPVFVLMLCSMLCPAQQQPAPGTPAYQAQKAAGTLPVPVLTPRQKNYPVLRDARTDTVTDTTAVNVGLSAVRAADHAAAAVTAAATAAATACLIEDPTNDVSFRVLPANDDGSTPAVSLPFTFNLFGNNYTQLYINNNGNVTFDASNGDFTATGFPSSFDMIAPFWADVDTRGFGSGLVYYKAEATRFTIIWYQVGYYDSKADKRNTFKLILTDGTDAIIGAGNNVAFFYGNMQWTTGDASGGTDGFGGSPATVGLNNGQGEGACFYYQLGRFGKTGTEFVDPFTTAGVDYLDNQCFFFDASTIEDVSADFTVTNLVCAMDFVPSVYNPQNCEIYLYWWDFGDGDVSYDWNPVHTYAGPGTYTVSFNLLYTCGVCFDDPLMVEQEVVIRGSEDALIDTLIAVTTDVRAEVISASAATYSDSWPLQQADASLNDTHGFLNGSRGVWRNEGAHVYDVPRTQSSPPTLKTDGTFSLDHFNWASADAQVIPHWIKANTVTHYSPFSYEVENQDVLGVYSSALYDYGGHLPSANGVNMRHREMAFTGFEYLTGQASGNWVFGVDPLPLYYVYPTVVSYKNMAVVQADAAVFENVQQVDVTGCTLFLVNRRTNTIYDNEIICVRPHPQRPDWSLLVLHHPLFSQLWSGEVKINNEVLPTVTPHIDQTIAHSGAYSLKVTAAQTFTQKLIQLDSGKSYAVSAWVSVNNAQVATPHLADHLGIDITLRNAQGVAVGTFSFAPEGTVIEGWQQVKGVFTCPEVRTTLEITFQPGDTGTAWYDDLRLHPEKGNMQSYVYNLNDYRIQAILDEENFAAFFFYDAEGNLYLTQKETEDGIKTLTENMSYLVETN